MDTSDDWRLRDQAKYLRGAVFKWQSYQSPGPDWDHDHCEFCFVKFMDTDAPDILRVGFVTEGQRWVCAACFQDFRARFDFQ